MKKYISYLSIIVILFIFIGCCYKGNVQLKVASIEIIEYGKFSTEETKRDFTRNSDMGGVRKSRNHKLIEHGDTFFIEIGKNIGFRYQIKGSPSNGEKEITLKIIYPYQGITNPKNGKTKHFYQSTSAKEIGKTYFHSFYFRHDWEAVPGKWVFQVLVDGKMMAEKQFNMTTKKNSKRVGGLKNK